MRTDISARYVWDMSSAHINQLVRKHTAFTCLSELHNAQMVNGYVPTITKKSEQLGQALEALGYRVWRSKG